MELGPVLLATRTNSAVAPRHAAQGPVKTAAVLAELKFDNENLYMPVVVSL